MPFWCVLNSWLVVQKLSTHQFPEIILFLTFLFLSQIRQKSLSLSKTIHSVLHKLFHKYYVVFWSICERANSAFLILRNGARGEQFWEPADICLGWSILCDVELVWLVYGRVGTWSIYMYMYIYVLIRIMVASVRFLIIFILRPKIS